MHQEPPPAKVASNELLGHTDPARTEFERHVLQWTGRDMEYHHRNGTTGLEFAWHCWQAGCAAFIARAPIAVMDTRTALGLCATTEADFPALYALQGHRVAIVDFGA